MVNITFESLSLEGWNGMETNGKGGNKRGVIFPLFGCLNKGVKWKYMKKKNIP